MPGIRTSIVRESIFIIVRTRTTLALLPLFLALTLASLGCTSRSGPTLPDTDFFVQSRQPFALRVGDTAGVVGLTTIFVIHFSAVLADNRCPQDVTCVQEGAVSLVLTVQTSLDVQDVTIEVPPSGEAEVVVAEELRIRVIEVAPPAREGVELDLLDYAVAMTATDLSAPPLP